jgi:hypothetical protein
MIPYTGMPDPFQMPQQQMILPPMPAPARDMTIDLLGIKVPAEMLSNGSFWIFLLIVLGALVATSYFKNRAAK